MKIAPEVAPDEGAAVRAAAEHFCSAGADACRAAGRFVVALSGGATPRALYQLLATPSYAARVDWTRTHVCWGDERCVPPEDGASNYRMARGALLDRVPIPLAQVHRIRGEAPPAVAAADYERELRGLFPGGEARFDLVLLGVGTNGHTASLFPRSPVLREQERWVVADYVAEVSMWRVTLTAAAINDASSVLVLAVGAGKAAIVREVLAGPYRPDDLPVQAIAPRSGRLTWLLDAAAAAAL